MNVATTTAGLTDLKFRLAREDFADAVAWVARNLPSRPTVPVLAGVLLTGTDESTRVLRAARCERATARPRDMGNHRPCARRGHRPIARPEFKE